MYVCEQENLYMYILQYVYTTYANIPLSNRMSITFKDLNKYLFLLQHVVNIGQW